MTKIFCFLAILLTITSITRAQSWSITGNAGTNPSTNFIGTTDSRPLLFRINNGYHGMLSSKNVFFGQNAGFNNVGYSNIAIGNSPLFTAVALNQLIGIGDSAMFYSGTGPAGPSRNNIAIGSKALFANIDGTDNTVVGYRAGYSVTGNGVGDGGNTVVGSEALHAANGQWNTAIGYRALYSGTSSVFNTAVGYLSLSNSNGYWNTALGSQSLHQNISGIQNTASGSNSLEQNTTGHNNTAAGSHSLKSNTTGYSNVAIGMSALYWNKNRHNLVAVGDSALFNNGTSLSFSGSEGSYSTAVGSKALYNCTNGYGNTAIGYRALYTNTTGYYNTALGYNAYPSSATVNNYTGIGYLVGGIGSVSNSVEIGNSSVTWIGGQVGWSTYSDGRIKENIKEDIKGLEFIARLRPVSYNLNIHKQNEILQTNNRVKADEKEWPEKYEIERKRTSGFIAQEVEEAAKQLGYEFPGLRKPQSAQGLYSLTYAEFVVPLVKAVQEQQALIERLTKKIEELEKKTAHIQPINY